MDLGCLDQVLASLVQQTAVSGVRYRLGHDSGVHDDPLYAAG